ncbi:MAG: hypothetical protein DMG90_10350, partial [Acidobacteria bacterium]
SAQKASEEGNRFFKLTQDLQGGGEVAHSDVIKAELQMNDRRRQLQEAQLMFLNARIDLAVLLFPDFNENYEVADDLHSPVPLPTLAEVQQQAARDNPDVRAALEAVRAAGSDVTAARAAYLPSLSLDYWYGIDAAQFAVNGPNGLSNLGSSAAATLNIPIWNWGATQSRIKQAELRRTQAKRELSLAQRKLLAEIQSLYAEADTALNELAGLNRSAELAADSLRLTMLRYTGGEATILEVVDAQNTSVQANTAYQDGAVRYRVALANLPDGSADNSMKLTRNYLSQVARNSMALVCAALGPFMLGGCGTAEKEKEPVVSVQIGPAQRGPIAQLILAEAVVYPLEQATVAPKITSTVKHFLVQRGSPVKKGQLLAELENKDLEAAVHASKGEFEQADASYKTTVGASLPQQIQKAELDAVAAKPAFDAQQKVHDRRKEIFQQGAIPR